MVLCREGRRGTFTDSGQSLSNADSQAVALGDLDGDGNLDALVANNGANRVWLNDGLGSFTDSGQNLGSSLSWAVALGDLDDDGDQDAFVGNFGANKVWLNDGGLQGGTPGAFSDSDQNLGSANSYSVAVGDLDGEGDLDAFVGNVGANKVWLNDSAGAFTDSDQSLGAATSESAALGDVDGDGDLDAFVANNDANEVWLNDGSGTFSDSGQRLGNSSSNSVALGDLDGDGDLDAFVANAGPNKVWLNQGGVGTGGTGFFIDSGRELGNWETDSVALGDLDGDGDLDAFLAGVGPNKIWLNDGGLQGGTPGNLSDSGQELGDSTSTSVALGDLDGDGDLDAFVANYSVASLSNKVWLNDGECSFSDNGQALGNSNSTSVALGDLDGDGDLDAFVTNITVPTTGPDKVWLNDGAGMFSDSGQDLGNADSASVALGDLDGDGDLDAFVAQSDDKEPGNKVWLNDGGLQGGTAGNFGDSGQYLGSSSSKDVALGDLDSDGDLDAFVANSHYGTEANKVWLNDGSGSFAAGSQNLGDSNSKSVALGDLDGDGDLDAFVANSTVFFSHRENKVWLNGEEYAQGKFTEGQCLGNSISTSVALGDLDGDGDLDALVGNTDGFANRVWLNERAPEYLSCICTVEWIERYDPSSGLAPDPVARAYSVLRPDAIDLNLFHRVRDELLGLTPVGRQYIDLYYTHNYEILGLLVADPALRDEGAAALKSWQPNLQALLDGQSAAMTITAAQVLAVEDFLAYLSAAGSSQLQQAIAGELDRLGPLEDFVGMTLEEARGVLIGYTVYLPTAIK